MLETIARRRKFNLHPCGNYRDNYFQELAVFQTDFGRLWIVIGLLFLFGAVPWLSGPYMLYVINMAGIAAIAAIGLNILIGMTGQISLGHGAFLGVGAYAGAVLATSWEMPFYVSIPAAGLITALAGMVFGAPSGRLKGLYLTIATLAGQFIIEYILIHWESVTRGTMGITLPAPELFGVQLSGDRSFFFLIFASAVLLTWAAVNLTRTRHGRAFVAIRDNDRAAEGMGIPVFRYKLLSFGISSFYAGVAGAIWAYYMISVTTEPFTLSLSVEYIAMVIIGGLGSISGSIFGAVFITFLNEGLRFLADFLMNSGGIPGFEINFAPIKDLVFGMSIVLFILFEPKGLAEMWRVIRSNFKLWPFSY